MASYFVVALLIGVLLSSPQQDPNPTYDAVVRGMNCTQQANGQLECDYKVGRSLKFAIAGVGEDDAAITFFKVDFDGDYYATVGVLHGCVIVKPSHPTPDVGLALAFVSPRNGKVYTDWPSCAKANGR